MSKVGLVELMAEGVSYFSRHDEDCFFIGLGSLSDRCSRCRPIG
jgi:hypothetical protein